MAVEHWTMSRRGLVLVGSHDELRQLATELKLPTDTIVPVNPDSSALGLWGEPLSEYQRRAGRQRATREAQLTA